TIFFGLRNIEDYEKAISEIYRILKPGGEILYLDFGKSKYTVTIFNIIVNIVAKIFFQDIYPYRYLLKSKEEFMVEYDLVNEFKQKNIELIEQKKYVFNTILTLLLKKCKE
ncbi:class I SAM-dependent methyltransferase, partial [bacterium]|nr:class I SAM-dependent methyltransferase [bacterium]